MTLPTEPPFLRIWEFIPAPRQEVAFARIYGSDGEWVRLFGRALGYLGTDLVPSPDVPGAWRTIDRWESEAAWIVFRQKHAAAYEALDRECEGLTMSERLIISGAPAVG